MNEKFTGQHLAEVTALDDATQDSKPTANHELSIWLDESHEDWLAIETCSGLSRSAYIEKLLAVDLHVTMTGFLPGFVYLGGLPEELHVPRKSNPSTRTRPGTFAIGGSYAGIYSLPSAAGWNCVGVVGQRIFDEVKLPPVSLGIGDTVKLKRVGREAIVQSEVSETSAASRQEAFVLDDQLGTLVFEHPGSLSLIQDEGRAGLAYYAIPRSGAMDLQACELANTILGNPYSNPVIECHFSAPRIRFLSEATICLTGADMRWRLEGKKVKRNRTIRVAAGSVLSGASTKSGVRAYIAIGGEIQTNITLGSSSTYLPGKFGGNQGTALATGDKLQWRKPVEGVFGLQLQIENRKDPSQLLLETGPEFHWLSEESKRALYNDEFRVSFQSDRMGARLDGPKLSTSGQQLRNSVPLLPGMVQLTPAGQLIVVLQDGQTTGGYPRVGYLGRNELRQLSQTKIGHPFCFEMAE